MSTMPQRKPPSSWLLSSRDMKPHHSAGLCKPQLPPRLPGPPSSLAVHGFALCSRLRPSPSTSLPQGGSLKQPGGKPCGHGDSGPCVWGELFQGSGDWDWVLPWEGHLLPTLSTKPLPTGPSPSPNFSPSQPCTPNLAPKIVLTKESAAPDNATPTIS